MADFSNPTEREPLLSQVDDYLSVSDVPVNKPNPAIIPNPSPPPLPERRAPPPCNSPLSLDEIDVEDLKAKKSERSACSLSFSMTVPECYDKYLLKDGSWESLEVEFVIRHLRHISSCYEHVHVFRCHSRNPVYRAVDLQGQRVILKSFPAVKGVSSRRHTMSECIIHSLLKHANITRVFDCFWCKDSIYLVMEEMRVDVYSVLARSASMPERMIRYIIQSCTSALDCIHKHGFLHRDVKTDNLLICDGVVKLGDFGYATCLTESLPWRHACVGSIYWMAPEVVRGELYCFAADIWSLGIVLLELVNGEPPFFSLSREKASFAIAKQDCHFPVLHPELWSSDLIDFCDACLQIRPGGRWTASQLLEHPFLSSDVATADEFAQFTSEVLGDL